MKKVFQEKIKKISSKEHFIYREFSELIEEKTAKKQRRA